MIRSRLRAWALLAWLLVGSGLQAEDDQPYLFVPRGKGRDDSARLQAVLDQGFRWIQFAGPDIQIDVPVLLGMPSRTDPSLMHAYQGITLEPSPDLERVNIHSNIGYDLSNPTNPSFAVFDWSGGIYVGSRLADKAVPGDRSIRVLSGQRFHIGDYIYISDTSLDPEWGYPKDGSLEVRAVVAIDGDTLKLDRPLRRPHLASIPIPGGDEVIRPVVAICHPIFQTRMRRLTFSGRANIGVHLHAAWGALLEDIDTRGWEGGTVILLDTGGGRNLVQGVRYRNERNRGEPAFFKWGIAMEGQEDTIVRRCTISGAQTGLLINFSVNTWGIETTCLGNEINFNIGSDVNGNPSMGSGLRSCTSQGSTHTAVALGDQSYACRIQDQMFEDEGRAYFDVGANAWGIELDGRLLTPINASHWVVKLGRNSTSLIRRRLFGAMKPELVIQAAEHSQYKIVDPLDDSPSKGMK